MQTYLIITLLTVPDLILVRGPEARAIWRKHFVNENDLVSVDVDAEFELCVGDDDTALCCVVPSLFRYSVS